MAGESELILQKLKPNCGLKKQQHQERNERNNS